ncbi:ABC transporter substrate-binding protein [Candidatus Acetothermia bacterium]|nr:ABC transporter substrate-binding protein [Candidatus Acetothermia bacterium]
MSRRSHWISLIVLVLLVSLALVSCNQSQKPKDQSQQQQPPSASKETTQQPPPPTGTTDKEKPTTPSAGNEQPQSPEKKQTSEPGKTADNQKSCEASQPVGITPTTPETTAVAGDIKNPDTLITADISDIDSLDPAFVYDTSSGEVLFHTYDNLLAYDGPHPDKFKTMLATTIPSVQNGCIKENPDGSVVISFPIRTGVKFHDGSELTPEDVAYSFQRLLTFDRSGGPSWLLLTPLLGVNSIEDLAKQIEAKATGKNTKDLDFKKLGADSLKQACERVLGAIQVNGDKVEFHLPTPFPPFFAVIAQSASWAAVISKKWAIAQGAWDGNCADWVNYHDPQKEKDPLYDKINGTGPFKLDYWDHKTGDISIVRNDDYWSGPAKLKKVIIKKVNEWSTRKLMLENGEADIATVDRQYIDQVDGMKGVRLIRGQIRMILNYIFMNQAIKAEGNDYIGSGKLDGNGIPPDFFKDVHVRRGFNYVFDWETYIREVQKNEAEQAKGPIPRGVPFYNPEQKTYHLDLKEAETHFKEAWGGKLWDKGFKLTAVYVSGGDDAKSALEIIRRNLQQVNPKFVIEIANVEWSTFLSKSVEGSMPLYLGGWQEDYHDAHNWVFPVMHSKGTYSEHLGIGTQYDDEMASAIKTFDDAKRQQVYNQLQQQAYEDAIAIFMVQPLGRHYQRRWVDGYYYNPIWPGRNFYVMSKKPDAHPNQEYIKELNLEIKEW